MQQCYTRHTHVTHQMRCQVIVVLHQLRLVPPEVSHLRRQHAGARLSRGCGRAAECHGLERIGQLLMQLCGALLCRCARLLQALLQQACMGAGTLTFVLGLWKRFLLL